jgi:hypothetical protein
MGTTQWRKYAVEELPLPDFSNLKPDILSNLERLVDERSDLDLSTSPREVKAIESEIDQIVYSLYGLSAEEVELVEAGI